MSLEYQTWWCNGFSGLDRVSRRQRAEQMSASVRMFDHCRRLKRTRDSTMAPSIGATRESKVPVVMTTSMSSNDIIQLNARLKFKTSAVVATGCCSTKSSRPVRSIFHEMRRHKCFLHRLALPSPCGIPQYPTDPMHSQRQIRSLHPKCPDEHSVLFALPAFELPYGIRHGIASDACTNLADNPWDC